MTSLFYIYIELYRYFIKYIFRDKGNVIEMVKMLSKFSCSI